MSSKEEKPAKKPFDKKKWRTKKYSKKQKLQDWDDRRKKAVILDYYKELNKSGIEKPSGLPINTSKPKKLNPHKEAKERYDKIQEEKKARRLEESKKDEISQKQIEYQQRKKRRNKILGKKTKKGQPVMKDRLKLLLEKIQSDCVNNDN